jgi:HSP20 family molecular chaperone IbpA
MKVDHPTIQVRVGSEPDEPGNPDAAHPAFVQRERQTYTPPIDIHEAPEGLTLEADLPGASERNLQILLEDNVLNLYATVDSPAPDGARLVHEEYRLGDYHRSFILSDEVDRDRITAELKNGVLRLFLPKAERARTRRIEIKSSDPVPPAPTRQ